MPKIRFACACPGAEKVFLAGDFNGWCPDGRRMKRAKQGEDAFVATVDLEPGRHEFKYVVDGEWICCPEAPRCPNEFGGENSVIEVCC